MVEQVVVVIERGWLFTTRYGRTYLFDESGVVAVAKSKFIPAKHLPNHVDDNPP